MKDTRFSLGECIGIGATAEVYKARDSYLGQDCALKIYTDPDAARLARERTVVEEVAHERLLPAVFIEYPEGRPALRMPLMTGTLKDRILPSGCPEQTVVRWAVDLLSALSYLDELGFVHRDVKPSNILLDAKGHAFLADFGLLRPVPRDRSETAMAGTFPYMAPEVLAGESELSCKADVYSAAKVLHELLTGANVFKPGTGIESWFGTMLRNAGALDPSKRWTAGECLRFLERKRGGTTLNRQAPRVMAMKAPNGAEDWRWLGNAMRCLLEGDVTVEQAPPLLASTLRGLDGEAQNTWNQIGREYARVAWPHQIHRASVADLLRARGVVWSYNRLRARVGARPFDPHRVFERDDRASGVRPALKWGNVPARSLGLARIVECLGRARRDPVDEQKFISDFAAALKLELPAPETPGGPLQMAPQWAAIRAALGWDRYRRVAIPKNDGSVRWLHIPNEKVAELQRRVSRVIHDYVPGGAAGVGFTPQRPTALHARYHAGAEVAVVVDIHDFFGSVTRKQVWAALHPKGLVSIAGHWVHPFLNWSKAGLGAIIDGCFAHHTTRKGAFLPQGGPSSPALANLVAQRLDSLVGAAVRHLGRSHAWRYSRYADDLCISSRYPDAAFHEAARDVLVEALVAMGWRATASKVRHWSSLRGGPLVLCGLRVPSHPLGHIELPRSVRRRVRAALNRIRSCGGTSADIGLVAYAYSATACHALVALLPGAGESSVRRLALQLAGERADEFVTGWVDDGLQPWARSNRW